MISYRIKYTSDIFFYATKTRCENFSSSLARLASNSYENKTFIRISSAFRTRTAFRNFVFTRFIFIISYFCSYLFKPYVLYSILLSINQSFITLKMLFNSNTHRPAHSLPAFLSNRLWQPSISSAILWLSS